MPHEYVDPDDKPLGYFGMMRVRRAIITYIPMVVTAPR